MGNFNWPLINLRWPTLLGIFAILGLAIWSRWPHLHESLWLDELHTAWVVNAEWEQLTLRAQAGHTGPLFFYLVRLVTDIFGCNEAWLRCISMTSGLTLVLISFWVMHAWSSRALVAMTGALLVAIDHHHIHFSLEARPYALVQLLGVIHVFAFWQLLQQPSFRWRITWVLLSVALFYLHYTTFWIVLADVVAWVALAESRRRYTTQQLLLDASLIAIPCAATSSHLMAVGEDRHLWSTFVIAGSPGRIMTLFPATKLVAIAIIFQLLARVTELGSNVVQTVTEKNRALITYLSCCLVVPLLGAWLLTRYDVAPVFCRRYLMVMATVPYLLLIVLTTIFPRNRWQWRVVFLCIGVASTLACYLRSDLAVAPRRRENWRDLVKAINASTEHAHLPVLVRSGLIEADRLMSDDSDFFRQYCTFPVRSIYQVSQTHGDPIPLPNQTAFPISDTDRAAIVQGRGAWLVFRGRNHQERQLINYLQDELKADSLNPHVVQRHKYGRLTLIRWAL